MAGNKKKMKTWSRNLNDVPAIENYDIIHISHGVEGDIPEYQPRGDTKALER